MFKKYRVKYNSSTGYYKVQRRTFLIFWEDVGQWEDRVYFREFEVLQFSSYLQANLYIKEQRIK